MKPRLKLIALILTSTLVINLRGVLPQALMAAIISLVLGKKIWPRLKPLLPVLIFILIGQTIFGDFAVGLATTLKIINLSLLVFIYSSFTPVSEISQTFAFLGPNAKLLITLTFSLVPIIIKEWQAISLVQKARGAKSLNPLPVIVPLLHRTFRRAEQLTLVLAINERPIN
jgi:energy-coupling factor transporter transmembrane protein EcfT